METIINLTLKEEKEIVRHYNAGIMARGEIRSKYKITNVEFTRIITLHGQMEWKKKQELYRVQ